MNYLTNYYKNLSEQLQEKINTLELYLHNLNEDLEPGIIQQGGGAGVGTGSPNQPNNNSDLNAFLQAWGTSNPSYDFNGDGVVDGNDLGIFLSNMISNGRPTTPTVQAQTSFGGTPMGPRGGKQTGKVTAIDQAGVENAASAGAGGFQTGGPNRPGITPTAEGGPVIRTKVPYSGPGANLGSRQNPPTQGNPPRREKRFPTPNTVSIQSETGSQDQISPTQGVGNVTAMNQGDIPYWMSTGTTNVDTSFRAMTPRRKK